MHVTVGIPGRIPCPCCGYPTLTEAAAYEICELCNWEDDGQGESDAGEVRGGPNGALSLTDARRNFRVHRVMYPPERDTRLWPDSEAERIAKTGLVSAFERLAVVTPGERPMVLEEIQRLEAILEAELHRQSAEYEARGSDTGAT